VDGFGYIIKLFDFKSFRFHRCVEAIRKGLIPWSRVLRKLIVAQLVKKLPAFYGTRKFINVLVRARHWSLSWFRCLQSSLFHLISPGLCHRYLSFIFQKVTYLHFDHWFQPLVPHARSFLLRRHRFAFASYLSSAVSWCLCFVFVWMWWIRRQHIEELHNL